MSRLLAGGRRVDRFLSFHSWVMPTVILLLLVPTVVGIALTQNDITTAQSSIREQQDRVRATVALLHSIQRLQHVESIEACERGNDSRVATIQNYRRDVEQLRLQREIYAERLSGELLDRALRITDASIAGKERAIHHTIASQASVAVAPGSPRADCERAYRLFASISP